METIPQTQDSVQPEKRVPHGILDGGGEVSEVLLAAIERCMAALGPGQVLEVFSQHPDARTDVPLWCGRAGHDLVHADISGAEFHFWIMRRGEDAENESQ